MIILAFDGSINSDWLMHYGIYAASISNKKLILLHVLNNEIVTDELNEKLLRAESLCSRKKVVCEVRIIPKRKNVTFSIAQEIGSSTDVLCLCGTRIRSRRKGILRGTVSEKLLKLNRFPVLAVRVVHPGMLGNPDRILVGISGRPDIFEKFKTVFSIFLKNAKELHILHVVSVRGLSFRGTGASGNKKKKGLLHVKHVVEKIKDLIPGLKIDTSVDISFNWPEEVLLHAAKLKINFILLGATDRTLGGRLFSVNRFERILRETPCDVGIYRNV